jgi:AmiR/NasT family two-component response regulator
MNDLSASATNTLPEDDPSRIGRATAVLMHRFGVDELRARRLLHRIAAHSGTSVEALAARVLATCGADSALWR